jgi:hypothetical protein
MAEKSCKVSVTDSDGNTHSVCVTASTLFTAAAAGIAAIRKSGWANVPYRPMKIAVTVNEVPVEHEVSFKELEKWASRPGGRSPAEIIERNRVKSLLGMPDERRA